MGPEEVSKDFYNQNTRSVLGFGIYYFSSSTNNIECVNVDILSHDFETDGLSEIRGFRLLREDEYSNTRSCLKKIIFLKNRKNE